MIQNRRTYSPTVFRIAERQLVRGRKSRTHDPLVPAAQRQQQHP
jgi:hypothetical protein